MSTECKACGERAKAIEMHHCAPKVVFGERVANTFPVVPMCKPCHARFHLGEAQRAKESFGRLSWSSMPSTSGQPCERSTCKSMDTRLLHYAFWSPEGTYHSGPICWSCFEVYVAGQRDYYRIPVRTIGMQTAMFR